MTPPSFLDRVVRFLASIRLTAVCLVLALGVVFWGTLAQVEMGLYRAQHEFFRSLFIYWGPARAAWRIPVFPGGYLVGGVLLVNLIAALGKRFALTPKRLGLWLAHVGLILLLLGQLLSDLLSQESTLHLREGQARNYSEAERETELAVVEAAGADTDNVVVIPQRLLAQEKTIAPGRLPFAVRVRKFFANSEVAEPTAAAAQPAAATQGIGRHAIVRGLARATAMNTRDVPSAVVEIETPQGSLGTWLLSEFIGEPQSLVWSNRTYQLTLRPRRYYTPYHVQLVRFQHEVYPGTDIPRHFSSRVRLSRADTGEQREVLIYMNNPLRYAGATYYQSGFDPDNHGTILQVVRNPSWLTPYLACTLVGAGLLIQFAIHLWGFVFKRRTA